MFCQKRHKNVAFTELFYLVAKAKRIYFNLIIIFAPSPSLRDGPCYFSFSSPEPAVIRARRLWGRKWLFFKMAVGNFPPKKHANVLQNKKKSCTAKRTEEIFYDVTQSPSPHLKLTWIITLGALLIHLKVLRS